MQVNVSAICIDNEVSTRFVILTEVKNPVPRTQTRCFTAFSMTSAKYAN